MDVTLAAFTEALEDFVYLASLDMTELANKLYITAVSPAPTITSHPPESMPSANYQ